MKTQQEDPITSPQNPKIKLVRALLERRRERTKTGLFVIEGEDLVSAAFAAGTIPEVLLLSGDLDENGTVVNPWNPDEQPEFFEHVDEAVFISGMEVMTVVPQLMAATSSLGSAPRVMAIVEQPWNVEAYGPLCLGLWGIKDPGNLGTAIRSAHAFGASSVVIGPETVDPFGPKAARASMGSIFGVNICRASSPEELPGETVALVVQGGQPLDGNADWLNSAGEGVSLIVGAERQGLDERTLAKCDRRAHLPIAGAESLNAAMAATAAMYELRRIRPS